MCSWFQYVRVVFEKQYTNRERIMCVDNDVERGVSNCICIPGVAINYVAGEIKACQEIHEKQKLKFEWSSEYKMYFQRKERDDWNAEIFDFKKQGVSKIEDAEFCERDVTEYTYIKMRNLDNKTVSRKEFIKLRRHLMTRGKRMFEVELYTTFASAYRVQHSFKDYVNALFRFFFFLHPDEGMQIIKQNMEIYQDDSFRQYNRELLSDYKTMIMALSQETQGRRGNMNELLKIIQIFLGVNLLTFYIEFKSEYCGDFKDIKDLITNKANDIVKWGSSGNVCVIETIMKELE